MPADDAQKPTLPPFLINQCPITEGLPRNSDSQFECEWTGMRDSLQSRQSSVIESGGPDSFLHVTYYFSVNELLLAHTHDRGLLRRIHPFRIQSGVNTATAGFAHHIMCPLALFGAPSLPSLAAERSPFAP